MYFHSIGMKLALWLLYLFDSCYCSNFYVNLVLICLFLNLTFACCFCFSLHLRSAVDILLLVLLMVLSGYLMCALLIGKYSSIFIAWPCAIYAHHAYVICAVYANHAYVICAVCAIQCCDSTFLFCQLKSFLYSEYSFLYCRLVYMARPHDPRMEKVVGLGFQPGFDPYKVKYYHFFALLCFLEATVGLLKLYNPPFSTIYGIADCKCISSWWHSVSRC